MTPLPGFVVKATAGLKGFDINSKLTFARAVSFRDAGYRFAIRYVPRHVSNPADIDAHEAANILKAGLGLMLVQHVLQENKDGSGWFPTAALGEQYGAFAALSANLAGYRQGGMIWLDLEGVNRHAKPDDVVAYCNNWFNRVGYQGFTPGVYVGYDAGLDASALYQKLRFEHYWSAYNLDHDKYPAKRGVQMKQHVEQSLTGVKFDPDEVQADNFGGLPLMHVDNEWTA
jgi:hypothetical protein